MSLCIYLSWVIYDWNFFCFSSNPTPLVALIRASTFKKYFKLMVISKKKIAWRSEYYKQILHTFN